jgi:dTDP-4-dehydrorhamnose reductase
MILLLGSTGLVGSAVLHAAPAGMVVRGLSSEDLDIRDGSRVDDALDTIRPARVINATGYTRVDAAERERDAAFALNVTAVGALAQACASRSIGLVHLSSDYVFDGTLERPYTERDAAHPINVYGESKLRGEEMVASSGARALIVRTARVFGDGRANFASMMRARAAAREPTRAVIDQHGSPTYAPDLAAALWQLIGADMHGVVHVANAGAASWYDVAERVFTHAGSAGALRPCLSRDYPTPARRPRQSVLDCTAIARSCGIVLRPWSQALDAWLHDQ